MTDFTRIVNQGRDVGNDPIDSYNHHPLDEIYPQIHNSTGATRNPPASDVTEIPLLKERAHFHYALCMLIERNQREVRSGAVVSLSMSELSVSISQLIPNLLFALPDLVERCLYEADIARQTFATLRQPPTPEQWVAHQFADRTEPFRARIAEELRIWLSRLELARRTCNTAARRAVCVRSLRRRRIPHEVAEVAIACVVPYFVAPTVAELCETLHLDPKTQLLCFPQDQATSFAVRETCEPDPPTERDPIPARPEPERLNYGVLTPDTASRQRLRVFGGPGLVSCSPGMRVAPVVFGDQDNDAPTEILVIVDPQCAGAMLLGTIFLQVNRPSGRGTAGADVTTVEVLARWARDGEIEATRATASDPVAT